MSYIFNDKITYKDSGANDAFGRLRTSGLFTVFDSKQIGHDHSVFYDVVLSGGTSEYNYSGSSTNLILTGGTSGYVIRQTKQRFNYQTGKSTLVLLTGVYSTEPNIIKRSGFFDSKTIAPYDPYNGIYFENNNGILSFNIVKNGVVNKVLQQNWDIDKLDGSGNSGIELDINKSQIIVMDAEWLGVGRVRVGFNIDGITYYVHYFEHANNIIGVYTQYLNLPIRYEIRGNGDVGSIEQICATVGSEGGVEPTGVYRTIKRDVTLSINTGIYRPLIAIRLQDESYMGNVLLENLSLLGIGKNDYYYSLKFYNGDELVNINGTPTLWDDVLFTPIDGSFCEYKNDFDTTYVVNETTNNGITVLGGFVSETTSSLINQIKNSLAMGVGIRGEKDVISLEVKSLTANDNLYGSITWREL